jgi:hypothetical protein
MGDNINTNNGILEETNTIPPENIKIPKKRGRKPKIKIDDSINVSTNDNTIEPTIIQTIKVKRGRKPKLKGVEEVKKYEEIKDVEKVENNTVILKLHVDSGNESKTDSLYKDEDREKDFLNYSNTEILDSPKGYNAQDDSTFYSNPEFINYDSDKQNDGMDEEINKLKKNDNELKDKKNANYILEDFIERDTWPIGTDCACFWCCHSFSNTPYGIPFKYINNKFVVYGCFCSLECCVSYNFSSHNSMHDKWENFSLINLLAHKLNYKNFVKASPPRELLKMFGGHMEIIEYREYCNSTKILNVLNYPMIASQHQIEEINEQNLNNNRVHVAIDTERIKKIEQKFKLLRQKPILSSKNTLDHTMKLKVESTEKI